LTQRRDLTLTRECRPTAKKGARRSKRRAAKSLTARSQRPSCPAIGVAIGIAMGTALHNIGLGIALGVAFGAAFEGASRRKARDRQETGERNQAG
jgi:F0F1-type ATP synthase membrane subunit c/vacuolar-type H+-ATPase subunit K